jgi:predicted acylesterase/phospholipase RssA
MERSTDAPPDRFCDLVMKGGLTSGIVYPKAIALLAACYRFKSIGGTSAGAIAAAMTAAAELNRRKNNTRASFDSLAQLPDKLQERLPGTNKSRLLSLFQTQPGTRRLFFTLVFALNSRGTYRRIAAVLAGLLMAYWPATLASIVAAVAVFQWGAGLLGAVLLVPLALLLAIGFWVYVDITRKMPANGFGLCRGLGLEAGNPALTPWLHEQIQRAAGLGPDADPLTFGDLWDAPGFPPPWIEKASLAQPIRSIDLQIFSTNLAHGRPYIFPLAQEGQGATPFRQRDRLYFRPDELVDYLPADVLAWMRSHSEPYQVEPGREESDPTEAEGRALGLRTLPSSRHLPVLLAARMSLSFPFLLSAVPLWAINHDAPKGKRHFACCWFSDGGISSNFPMHLFDGLVPLWPTFGVSLEPKIAGRGEVYLPERYESGYGERWNCFAEKSSPASRFGGFLSAIVRTMQNWNDNSLARMPGVRDRIARVRLEEDEGGMNLNMDAETITRVSQRGEAAAQALLARFDNAASPERSSAGWDEQRFVRLSVLLKMIEARIPGVTQAIDPRSSWVTDFDTLIDRAMLAPEQGGPSPAPPGYEGPLTQQQADELRRALAALALFASDSKGAHTGFKPVPNPELRVRPPL